MQRNHRLEAFPLRKVSKPADIAWMVVGLSFDANNVALCLISALARLAIVNVHHMPAAIRWVAETA